LKETFKDFSNDEILQALSSGSEQAGNPSEDPRIAEFDMMASGAPVIGSDGAGSFFWTGERAGLAMVSKPSVDFCGYDGAPDGGLGSGGSAANLRPSKRAGGGAAWPAEHAIMRAAVLGRRVNKSHRFPTLLRGNFPLRSVLKRH
jgi:hypothetical protein